MESFAFYNFEYKNCFNVIRLLHSMYNYWIMDCPHSIAKERKWTYSFQELPFLDNHLIYEIENSFLHGKSSHTSFVEICNRILKNTTFNFQVI